jgi:hypothetical protein
MKQYESSKRGEKWNEVGMRRCNRRKRKKGVNQRLWLTVMRKGKKKIVVDTRLQHQ